MQAIKDHPGLELTTICAGTMVLERFGKAVDIVRKDGFDVDSEIFIEIEGSNPDTAAKTIGLAIIEFSTAFKRIKPDIVLMVTEHKKAGLDGKFAKLGIRTLFTPMLSNSSLACID